jgi:hypothetical protein
VGGGQLEARGQDGINEEMVDEAVAAAVICGLWQLLIGR